MVHRVVGELHLPPPRRQWLEGAVMEAFEPS